MRRPLMDLASQAFPLATNLLDRILLTGLLVRLWGVTTFEQWSILVATVTMLTIADLGCQLSFSNKLADASSRDDTPAAVRIFRETNTVFVGLGLLILIGSFCLAYFPAIQDAVGFTQAIDGQAGWAVLLLGAGVAVRTASSNQMGVYRANLSFARGTTLSAILETVRVLALVAVVAAGADILGAAITMFVAAIIGQALLVWIDIQRQFPAFRFRLARPTRFSMQGQLRLSALYSLPFVPSVIFVQLPVIIIGSSPTQTGVLAGFILLRTLSNFLRTVVQKFTFIVGMELSRLATQNRTGVYRRLYATATLAISCCLGFVAGILLGFGPDIVFLWSGEQGLFDPLLMVVMLLPLVITPAAQVIHPLLLFSSRPGPIAAAIVAQAIVALGLAIFLPIESIALRLTIAIFGSEIIPLAPMLIAAARRQLNLPIALTALFAPVAAMTSCLLVYGAITYFHPLLDGITRMGAFLGIASILFVLAMFVAFKRPLSELKASL